jgi:hypothetical protein
MNETTNYYKQRLFEIQQARAEYNIIYIIVRSLETPTRGGYKLHFRLNSISVAIYGYIYFVSDCRITYLVSLYFDQTLVTK